MAVRHSLTPPTKLCQLPMLLLNQLLQLCSYLSPVNHIAQGKVVGTTSNPAITKHDSFDSSLC